MVGEILIPNPQNSENLGVDSENWFSKTAFGFQNHARSKCYGYHLSRSNEDVVEVEDV